MKKLPIIALVFAASLAGNVWLAYQHSQDVAEIAHVQAKFDDLQRSFDLYVETEQRANTLKKEAEHVYQEERKKADAALNANTDWAHLPLPDDIRGVLKKDRQDPVPAAGKSAR